jgi:hypothetical protein
MFLGYIKGRHNIVDEELLQGECDVMEVSKPQYMCFLFVLHVS